MKRLILFIPLLVLLAGCGATSSRRPAQPLTHTATVDNVPLRLDVTRLSRLGNFVSLNLRLTNRGPSDGDAFSIAETFSREGTYDLGGVVLLDPQTGREFTPLQGDGHDVASMEIASGGSQAFSVAFRDLRAKTADVLVPHFGLFRDVPVR